jgi:hypothetical protein
VGSIPTRSMDRAGPARRPVVRWRRWFLASSWLPPAIWGATLVYLRPYDGWGAWAAAPLLLPSVWLAAAWLGVGLLLLVRNAVREGALDLPLLVATVTGGAALIYYTAAYWLRQAG